MSKRYKGKACPYCGLDGVSRTADHIFAREFFLPALRDGLPKVPACEACNHAKSELEHYLTTLLPFGGNHPDSHPLLTDRVPDRLAANKRLWRELSDGAGRLKISENGGVDGRMGLPFEAAKLTDFARMLARGLACG